MATATLTAAQVKNILERVAKEKPERWAAAVQSMLVKLAEDIEKLRADLDKVAQAFAATLRGAPVAAEEVAADPPAEEVGAAGAAIHAPSDEGRATPLTPEQASLEAQMDAAISAEQVAKTGASPVRPARTASPRADVVRRPKQATPAPAAPKDPEALQAELEAQMDAALANTPPGQ